MSIEQVTLYHFPGSRSVRARWALLETLAVADPNASINVETLQLMQGEHYRPDFLAMNPNHAVPVLEIQWKDGAKTIMLESTAIVEWLADAYPDLALAPVPGLSTARADYLQMMQFAGSWMDAMLWQIRVQRDLLPEAERDQKTIDRTLAKFRDEVEPQLSGRLTTMAFICGDQFSAADILMGHNVFWARAYGLCQDSHFKAYLKRLSERPAFTAAFEDVSSRLLAFD